MGSLLSGGPGVKELFFKMSSGCGKGSQRNISILNKLPFCRRTVTLCRLTAHRADLEIPYFARIEVRCHDDERKTSHFFLWVAGLWFASLPITYTLVCYYGYMRQPRPELRSKSMAAFLRFTEATYLTSVVIPIWLISLVVTLVAPCILFAIVFLRFLNWWFGESKY